jgi:2-hydroxychromene-2-carboxylate isomerase
LRGWAASPLPRASAGCRNPKLPGSSALTESGFDAERLIEASSTPAVKAELIANTERAVERGAFGAPTFFIDGELWFGKDRLNDVEQAIVTRLSAAK